MALPTKDKDTDPSTPSARRPVPRPDRPVARPDDANSTDPGLGPPTSGPIVTTDRGLSVVVPAPGPVKAPAAPAAPLAVRKADSVDVLLEGIAGPRPGRARTTPQTGGEASAAYHAEHGLHPAKAPLEAESKVVVERQSLARTLPPSTPAADKNAPTGGAAPRSASLRSTLPSITTFEDLRRRVIVAIAAGLIVVFGIFGVLRMTSRPSDEGRPSPQAARVRDLAADPSSPSAPPAPVTGLPDEVVVLREAPFASAAEIVAPAPAPAPDKASTAARSHPTGRGAPAGAASGESAVDYGEFKTKF
ncbi:MAG: hypothetical protein FWD17_04970 [Polyangiaceae bacterium]|nr:hypothetical protein [Polyangiaceae bacterium]